EILIGYIIPFHYLGMEYLKNSGRNSQSRRPLLCSFKDVYIIKTQRDYKAIYKIKDRTPSKGYALFSCSQSHSYGTVVLLIPKRSNDSLDKNSRLSLVQCKCLGDMTAMDLPMSRNYFDQIDREYLKQAVNLSRSAPLKMTAFSVGCVIV